MDKSKLKIWALLAVVALLLGYIAYSQVNTFKEKYMLVGYVQGQNVTNYYCQTAFNNQMQNLVNQLVDTGFITLRIGEQVVKLAPVE